MLSPAAGDPDMFARADGTLPGRLPGSFVASAEGFGADALFLDLPTAGVTPPCTLLVGVFGWSASKYAIPTFLYGGPQGGLYIALAWS